MTADLLGPADPSAEGADDVPAASGSSGRAGRSRVASARREALAVVAGSVALSAAMTWPVLRHPSRTVPQDLVDPLYFVWQIAWTGHALRTDPLGMWTTNAFNHAGTNLAYTDTMIGYAPFAAVFDLFGGMGSALLSYNLLYVLAAALAFGSAYLLARVLGADIAGALVLAAAYGFAPWRLAHARHLNVLSTGGIVLALALLAYGHGWTLRRRAQRDADRADRADQAALGAGAAGVVRPKWIVAGWVVACWQLTLGFAVGIAFAWVLGGVMLTAVVLSWKGRPWDRRMVRADLGGGLAFAVLGVALTLPYLSVIHRFPVAARTEGMVDLYSPHGQSLFIAPAENWWWGAVQASWRAGLNAPAEQALLPGLVVTLLALAGLRWSVWTVRARCGLGLLAVVFAVLALGVSAPGGGRYTYLILFHHLPGWSALRTPGRLVLWCGLALGLLAAGAVTYWAHALRERSRPATGDRSVATRRRSGVRWMPLVFVLPALLVLSEGAGAVAQPRVPTAPVALKDLPGPLLVMPTSMQGDYLTMTWSTDGWPDLVNGGSGFESPRQSRLRRIAAQFPDPSSVTALRTIGVRTIVLVRSRSPGTAWEKLATQPVELTRAQASAAGVLVREASDSLIFELN